MGGTEHSENDPETFLIIGAAIEAHKELGPGFLEIVYQEAFAKELLSRRVPHEREAAIEILYKGEKLPCTFRADFVCCGTTVVELKAIPKLGPGEQAQILHYLKSFGYPKALLLNFGSPSLEIRRFIRNDEWK